ncbi:MAG: acetoacetate--CoA ligase [Alphaproteobacteria bacterium]|nr:acetoacetate--CoA ligase [Alphaproteobacteria bacterium]
MKPSSVELSVSSALPLWTPPRDGRSRMEQFAARIAERTGQEFNDYQALHCWSVTHLEEFWDAVWDFGGIIAEKSTRAISPLEDVPWARFFPDAKISYAENCLNQFYNTPEAPAVIARVQGGGDRVLSWRNLYESVSRWEQILRAEGLGEGEAVGVYLPNCPETISVFLAASVIGAVFVSAGMEMGPADLIGRFGQIQPKILITAPEYVHGAKIVDRRDVVEQARRELSSLQKILWISGPSVVDIDQFKPKEIEFIRRDFNHPLCVLFSSGSTGKPKGFEHSSGGVMLKHLSEHQLHCDIRPGDRVFYHATPSWMMWNWLAGALASGATILMYDGSPAYPDAYAQWDFTAAHGCTHHGTAAPLILGWAKEGLDIARRHDLSPLRMVLSTGAVLPPQGYEYIHTHVKETVKISSISGGTDIVGCFLGGNPMMPTYAGQINGPMLGMDARVWTADQTDARPGETGELVCLNAFPSMPLRFLNDAEGAKYRASYFDQYGADRHVWHHGDAVQRTPEGQLVIIGRSDATLNQNGVRIGTSVIYEQLRPFAHLIREAAAIDFTRPDNRQALTVLFLALESGESAVPEDLQKAIRAAVKNNVTPYAIPGEIIAVPGILKTPNGKIAEVVMKKIINGEDIPNASLYGADLVERFRAMGRTLAETYGAL